MSTALISTAAEKRYFYPRHRFHELAEDHVPFDRVLACTKFEARALRECVEREGVVGVLGPRGGGKSSLIAYVCDRLPDTHLPLRVPVAVVDNPASIEVICALALSRALGEIELRDEQRRAIEKANADEITVMHTPGGVKGGKVGGGYLPAELRYEVTSLSEELRKAPRAAERFAGLDRLITILVSRGVRPVFVLEDTEAAIGGDDPTVAGGFLGGPVRAFARELDAALVIAVQDVFKETDEFGHLMSSMAIIEIPTLDDDQARSALAAIVENRLDANDVAVPDASAVLEEEAFERLVAFYRETGRNLRFTLAMLQMACEMAAEDGAEAIGAGHLRAATEAWRDRTATSAPSPSSLSSRSAS
jgi:hypothetical protein